MVGVRSVGLSEEVMQGAVVNGHEQGNVAIAAINELVKKLASRSGLERSRPRTKPSSPRSRPGRSRPARGLSIRPSSPHPGLAAPASQRLDRALSAEGVTFDKVEVEGLLFEIEARIVRSQILAGEPRIDGRDTAPCVPSRSATACPRTHGSAPATRGETQALVIATLGTEAATPNASTRWTRVRDRFMLHYNMPPTPPARRPRGQPKRREISHGRLANARSWPCCRARKISPPLVRGLEITGVERLLLHGFRLRRLLALMDAGVP